MKVVRDIINNLNYIGFILAAAMIFFISAAVCAEVGLRYFFNSPTTWVTEYCGYVLVFTTFMAAGHTLKLNGHTRVEFLLGSNHPTRKFVLELIAFVIMCTVGALFAVYGFNMVYSSFIHQWTSNSMIKTPLWIPQLFFPLGGTLFFLQSLLMATESITTYRKGGVTE